MDTSNPGPLLMLGGGVAVVVGTILDWGPSTSGLDVDFNGLFGIVALLLGLGLAAVGGIKAFSPSTALPDSLLGLSLGQLCFAEALTVFLWSFSLISEDGIKFGVHLTWLGAVAAAVGAILMTRNEAVGAGSPTSI